MFSNSSGRQGMSFFNRRRRPRQAVYASPSQNTSTPLHIDIPDEALAEIAQDFENNPKNYNHFASNSKPYPSYQTANTSSRNRQFSVPQKHPSNFGNENTAQKKLKLEQDSWSRERNDEFFGQQQRKGMAENPGSTRNGFQSNKFQTSTKKNFSFVEKSTLNNKLKQSYSSGSKSEYTWNNTNSPAKGTMAGSKARQPTSDERASFGATMNMKNENPTPKKDVSYSNQSVDTGFTIQTVDKTMKFVTSTIQGVRKWSEYRDQIPLIFEVFVTLDSVPTSNNNGTAKLFNIKDSTGSIRCIYWEMDQKLPRVARGQMYRLVGALERKTGHFQCYTIRQVQGNEQRLAKQQVEMCDESMTKLISMMVEA